MKEDGKDLVEILKKHFYTEMPERGKRLILTPVLNICMKPLFVDHL